jgi:CMP-N,N'-diacetyllegionaminic acid synthase
MSLPNVLALIPARSGSKGIPHKNFKPLAGISPLHRALRCAWEAGIEDVRISTDHADASHRERRGRTASVIQRPPELAQDDTPMIAVVQHALAQIPGPPEQIILLLQPTQPLRQPKHLTAAIELLQSSGADSVVRALVSCAAGRRRGTKKHIA